ncbi:MAG: hypothetical protein AB7U35_15710 [Sphingobium sp.]
MNIGNTTASFGKNLIKYMLLLCIISHLVSGSQLVLASDSADSRISVPLSYADTADLVSASGLVMTARIKSVRSVTTHPGSTPSEGTKYLLVNAEVESLIRGDNGVSPMVSFLALPNDGKSPAAFQPKSRQTVLIFARPAAKPGQLSLVSRYAMQPWSAELEATVRSITAEVVKPDAAPAITAIGNAFHIAGTIAGESETQIFLKTATGVPVSLTVLRRPGQPPRWGVSLGEIIDDSAVPPAPSTLLWYRLACSLPGRLPSAAMPDMGAAEIESAQRDYAFVLESLGRCGRTL